MTLVWLLTALWMTQVPPPGLPPSLRAELPPGKVLIYDLHYSRGPSAPTPAFPKRLYIPSAALEEPGIWGEGYFLVPPNGVAEGQFVYKNLRLGPTWRAWESTGGETAWGSLANSSGGQGQFGGPLLLDPCLYGFYDPDVEERADSYQSFRHSFSFSATYPKRVGELWLTEGTWYGRNPVTGRYRHANGGQFFFDPRQKVFTRVLISEANLGETLHMPQAFQPGVKDPRICPHPPNPPVDLEFLYRSTEDFPPPDLDQRIQTAILRGAGYLSEHAAEVRRAPWFDAYPVGTRAIVAWAILLSGGDLQVARRLLDEAVREPLRTTYDAAFLVLALDALLAWEAPAPAPAAELPKPGVTGVARSTTMVVQRAFASKGDEKKHEKMLEVAVGHLLEARDRDSGLWGYNPGGRWCQDTDHCPHTTCWPHQLKKRSLDVSNSFWALEALGVAAQRGYKIPPDIWDKAARSLATWGSYFRNRYETRYRSIYEPSGRYPEEVRRRYLERERLDRTLRWTRRLPLKGNPGMALPVPDAHQVELQEVSLWPYTDYVMDYGSILYFKDSTGPLFQATMGYAPHLCGVGSLIQTLRGMRQNPLDSKLVQQGLLFARLYLRYALATYDIRPCDHLKAHAAADVKYTVATPPRDLSFNFLVLERVLDGLGIDQFGSHDWFPFLALHSLDLQYEDGGWYAWREDRLVPTALHLLFLMRSRKPEPTDELPSYQPAPITTGVGKEASSIAAALVEGKGGRLHRVVEVLWSLQWVGNEERVRLAEKALERLTPEQRRELLPRLEAIARKGPPRAKAFAERARAAIETPQPMPEK